MNFLVVICLTWSALVLQENACQNKPPPPVLSPPTTSHGFQSADEKGCPPFVPTFNCGPFDPANLKCKSHADCTNGQLCCSEGCGKECKDPAPKVVHPATKP